MRTSFRLSRFQRIKTAKTKAKAFQKLKATRAVGFVRVPAAICDSEKMDCSSGAEHSTSFFSTASSAMPFKLTGARLSRFNRIITSTNPKKKELQKLKATLQQLEANARRSKERRRNIRALKLGAERLAEQASDAFKDQEERFMKLIAKEERRVEKQEQAEKKALRRVSRKERVCVLYAHYEVRRLVDDGSFQVVLHPERGQQPKASRYEVVDADRVEAHGQFSYSTSKQLKAELAKREAAIRESHEENHFYSAYIKILKGFSHQISVVHKADVPLEKVPMRAAFTLRRDWLRFAEGIAEQSYEDLHGTCVYELLIGLLGSYWTTVTKEKLFDMFKEAVEKHVEKLPGYLEGAPFYGKFTMDSGVNVDMLKYLCQKKKISLYGFDAHDHRFLKFTPNRKSDYRPICFYHVDGHMYLITSPEAVKSIASARDETATPLSSSMLEMDNLDKKKAEEREYVEAGSFEEAMEHTNTIVYLQQSNISSAVKEFIRHTRTLPQVKVRNHLIVECFFKDRNLTIICDPNEDGYTWKDIKAICDRAGVPFKNQQIGTLIRSLGKKFFKPERRVLTEEEKGAMILEQKRICAICEKRNTDGWHFDHVVSLNAGGSNELENFQALCVPCHLQKTKEEMENGDFIKYDPVASSFNPSALEIIQSNHFKQWAFVERLKTSRLPDVPIRKLDHAKCRRNLVMYGSYPFPKFSVMDSPEEFDGGEIRCGLYFVTTRNYFPFRGNGWYSYTMVKEALELKIIRLRDITHQLIASFQLPADYFKGFAEYLIEMSFDPQEPVTEEDKKKVKMDKLIVNSMVGCWARCRSSFESVRFDADKHRASSALCQEGTFVSSFDMDGTPLYGIFQKKEIQKDDFFLPLYHQIMSMEAMSLYKLERLIIHRGGLPLERNTDAILYQGPEIDISAMTHSDGTTLKYHYDDVKGLKVQEVCRFVRSGLYYLPHMEYRDFTESDDFAGLAKKIFYSNKGCFVSGFAGVGKTFFSRTLIDLIESKGKQCIKLAPTRKAASHIKGRTIHKFYMTLALSNNYEKKILKSLQHVDYMFVDEISMVKEVFYRFFTMLKRYAPQLKFIICGDFDQLPPVCDEYHGTYHDSLALYHLCDGQRLLLEKCRRSDSQVFDLYNGVRLGGSVDIGLFERKGVTRLNIAYTHVTRKQVNAMCMDHFREGRPTIGCAANPLNPNTQPVQLYEGMPIVGFKNDARKGLENSEMYRILAIDVEADTFSIEVHEPEVRKGSGIQKKTDIVLVDGKYILTLNASEFCRYFYPGFCITVHVSQGCSFDEPYTIYNWNCGFMEKRAKYVALSRARKIEFIHIVG